MKLSDLLFAAGATLFTLGLGCSSTVITPGSQSSSSSSGSGGSSSGSSACAGKSCGAFCTPQCPAAEPACLPPMAHCSANGECTAGPAVCQSMCQVDSDCPGLGVPCQQCWDGEMICPSVKCLEGTCVVGDGGKPCPPQPGQCTTSADCPQVDGCMMCPIQGVVCSTTDCINGACVESLPVCPVVCQVEDAIADGSKCAGIFGYAWHGKACEPIECGCIGINCGGVAKDQASCEQAHKTCKPYDPCAAASCGASCSLCDPGDPSCVEPAVVAACDHTATCASSWSCPPP